jgi:hypothetical protein
MKKFNVTSKSACAYNVIVIVVVEGKTNFKRNPLPHVVGRNGLPV